MSRMKKIIFLTLLISLCLFPASAFASTKNSGPNDKTNFLSNLFSLFTPPKASSSPPAPDKSKDDINSFFDDLFGWFDDKKDWFKDWHEWDDDYKDSLKLWEKYYCW
jgi:hypothetical protein